MTEEKKSNTMWGGRFSDAPDDIMESINSSIDFDKRLSVQDINASIVHVKMLSIQHVIESEDESKIIDGLSQILDEIYSGAFVFSSDLEDIHMNVENRLHELIGPAAGLLHTARSRNDQVATDFRLWVRDAIDEIQLNLRVLIQAFLRQAENGWNYIMPGFTHLQVAQPVTFGHHMLAYVEMFYRDYERFKDVRMRLNECPLGAAALAGTSFPIDRFFTAKALGFREPMRNSLDAVSDRDFALEFLSANSICATHLSRFSEEIIVWSSPQFDFIALSDKFSTGSSIMPQKKNPDGAELIRAKVGRVTGSLIALLTVMKGLPLAYSKDLQEDKEKVFDSSDTIILSIKAMVGMVNDLKPKVTNLRRAADSSFSTATDLADWLVKEIKLPFREAHGITGKIVKIADKNRCKLSELDLETLKTIDSRITKDIFRVLTVDQSVKSRKSFGGTAPDQVKKQVEFWKKKLHV